MFYALFLSLDKIRKEDKNRCLDFLVHVWHINLSLSNKFILFSLIYINIYKRFLSKWRTFNSNYCSFCNHCYWGQVIKYGLSIKTHINLNIDQCFFYHSRLFSCHKINFCKNLFIVCLYVQTREYQVQKLSMVKTALPVFFPCWATVQGIFEK